MGSSYKDGAANAMTTETTTPVRVKCALCANPMLARDSHNAAPVLEGGRCCEACNWSVVIPARLLLPEWR